MLYCTTVIWLCDHICLVSLLRPGVLIKKFQRSSADHELQVPYLIRTPKVLFDTVVYIEDNIIESDLFTEHTDNPISPIEVKIWSILHF